MTDEVTSAAIALAATEIAGRAGVPRRWLPLVAVLTTSAIAIGTFIESGSGTITGAIVSGLVSGAAAIGTYSGVKNTMDLG